MMDIEQFQVGDALLLMEFGLSTAGTIVDVDEANDCFVYETVDGCVDTIRLGAAVDNKIPGNVYDVHRHAATRTVVANFKSWQSGKYYEC